MNILKKSDTLEIQLTIRINFISSRDTDDECEMHSQGHNIEVMINDKVDKGFKRLFTHITSF